MSDELASVKLITALSRCWSAIRRYHPGVPAVVLLPAPSSTRRMNVLGYFAPVRWRTREDGQRLMHEVVVVAEHLKRGAAEVFETLLHEAAHAQNFALGVKDCSATSQYHNGHFKRTAEELGLVVTRVANYGFGLTRLACGTATRYSVEIDRLDSVLMHRRTYFQLRPTRTGSESGGTTATGSNTTSRSRSLKATCKCGFIIRVSRKTFDDTVIRCDRCEAPFNLA